MIQQTSTVKPRFGELASNAIHYWERRRLVYNLALTTVVVVHVAVGWPHSKALFVWDALLGLFALAVLANIVYCAAYAVDLFVQFSGSQTAWLRWRWVLLLIGTAFASVIAHFFMLAALGIH